MVGALSQPPPPRSSAILCVFPGAGWTPSGSPGYTGDSSRGSTKQRHKSLDSVGLVFIAGLQRVVHGEVLCKCVRGTQMQCSPCQWQPLPGGGKGPFQE